MNFNNISSAMMMLYDELKNDKSSKKLIKEMDKAKNDEMLKSCITEGIKRLRELDKNALANDIELKINNLPNALKWTLVNISELRFFDMSGIKFQEPYNQCRYCGKPNEFEHETGIKNFNKKIKYCHDFNCKGMKETDGSNPMSHENCCFGRFALSKKKLYQQMRAPKRSEEEKIKLFL